ncbi:MAG: helix-turn-helix domain-containing protein [Arcicella sp.]|nr:helix-turn-helix domain-containing protein [Arcicella sp.]
MLLQAGDSTSIVLPIKKVNEQTFQIEFQNDLIFVHDSLISLVAKNLKINYLSSDYIVNVLNCNNNAIVFGFEISTKNGNLTPCSGRTQGTGCYVIQIEFLASPSANIYPYLFLLISLAFVGFVLRKRISENKINLQIPENEEFVLIGNFHFYEQKNLLKHHSALIELTENESKLLKIFTENQNELVEREYLLKAIWEDKGIIVVGRSLDVLVSKLRKKLSNDETVKIINIHGKGYKMIVKEIININKSPIGAFGPISLNPKY